MSYKCESYKSWKKIQTWNSRINDLESDKAELIGHWHLIRIDEKEKGILDLFNTLDFLNDSTLILGKNIMESQGFYGSYENDQIKFDSPDLKANFKYTVTSNEELTIQNIRHGNFIASECDAVCCDHQIHFFHPSKVHIDLPVISQNEEYFERIERSLEFPIYIGLPKNEVIVDTLENYKVEARGEFKNINELSLIEEEFKFKVPNNKEDRIYRVIYADKNTPVKLLKKLINQLMEKSKRKVYIALRNKDSTKNINIYLKKVVEFKVNDELVLKEWINK